MPSSINLNWKVATASIIGAYVTYRSVKYLLSKFNTKPWKSVGKLSAIYVYPLKSGHPIEVQHAEATLLGLKMENGLADRHFLIVDEQNRFITARKNGKLVRIVIDKKDNIVSLSLHNDNSVVPLKVNIDAVNRNNVTRRCTLWAETTIDALDCGDEASEWLRKYIFNGDSEPKAIRLVYHDEGKQLYNGRSCQKMYSFMPRADKAVFSDLSPFMLATTPSLTELSNRLNNKPLMEQFRPNFVVDGDFEPWIEDNWEEIKIGNACFTNVKPCTRCVFTTIDVNTGERAADGEPLKTLKTYRKVTDPYWKPHCGDSPRFGINLAIDTVNRHVKVGDEVFVRFRN